MFQLIPSVFSIPGKKFYTRISLVDGDEDWNLPNFHANLVIHEMSVLF